MDNKEQKNKNNPVAPLVAGVVVGGAAVAAAMTLRDKKNREKVMKKVDEVKNKATKYLDEMKERPEIKEGAEKIEEAVKNTRKKVANNNK